MCKYGIWADEDGDEAADLVSAAEGALRRYAIAGGVTRLRVAHFLAQVLHESGRLRYTAEVWGPTTQQRKYDPASGSRLAAMLGNSVPGDGYRYRGRGLIQLTGRTAYGQYAGFSGLNVVEYPDLLCEPYCAADVAGWFWQTRGLNRWADADDIRGVTRRINGGFNGLEDRAKLLERAKRLLP